MNGGVAVVSENVGSDAGSQDDSGSLANESIGDTSPTGDDFLVSGTGEDKVSEVPVPVTTEQVVEEPVIVPVVPGSPSKDDQVLDAAAASPFLSPSGLTATKGVADVELTFSPGSETGTVTKAPVDQVMGDSPGVNQTAIRVSPPIPEEDLLRQSVDLATMPALSTTTPKATASAVAEDGSITVSVEPLEIVTGQTPKTDRSGSVPLSTTSPVVAYPQSPAVGVGATPLSASAVLPTPLSSSLTPKVGGIPSKPASPAGKPSSPAKVDDPKSPASLLSPAVPPAPLVAVLENAEATLTVTPMTPSLSIPPIPIASESDNPAHERSISRDRISAFISTTSVSPPRGTAMDSMALSEDPAMQRSIQTSAGAEPVIVAITESSAGPEMPFSPIDFETAIVRLTGRTGKSVRESPASPRSSSGGFFGSICIKCFGGKSTGSSSENLSKELLDDKNAQTTLLSTPFDSQFEIHRRMLQTVYIVLTGESSREALIGEHWKKIGFQSVDPATELNEKGNGVFHVLCMLYLLQEIGNEVRAGADQSGFAQFSIGLSSGVVALAKGGNLNYLYNRHRQVTPVSCHVHCAMVKRYLEVREVVSVVNQAQTSTGLAEIVNLVPYPDHVAVTAENATATALKASS